MPPMLMSRVEPASCVLPDSMVTLQLTLMRRKRRLSCSMESFVARTRRRIVVPVNRLIEEKIGAGFKRAARARLGRLRR